MTIRTPFLPVLFASGKLLAAPADWLVDPSSLLGKVMSSADGREVMLQNRLEVIATMRRTGADMSTKDKETSRGGLAVKVVECWGHHESAS